MEESGPDPRFTLGLLVARATPQVLIVVRSTPGDVTVTVLTQVTAPVAESSATSVLSPLLSGLEPKSTIPLYPAETTVRPASLTRTSPIVNADPVPV